MKNNVRIVTECDSVNLVKIRYKRDFTTTDVYRIINFFRKKNKLPYIYLFLSYSLQILSFTSVIYSGFRRIFHNCLFPLNENQYRENPFRFFGHLFGLNPVIHHHSWRRSEIGIDKWLTLAIIFLVETT